MFDRQAILSDWFRRLPASQQEPWLRSRKLCDRSLFYFVKDCGGFTPKSGGDISLEIHKPICDAWQDPKNLRQFVFMPRFWRKTTALTVWGNLWEYLQNPEVRILIPSEKQDTAAKWIMQIGNQALRNARLRWIYPELLMVDDSWIKQHRWSSLYLEFPRNGIYPEATIECTGIRGAAQGGHYDIISPDDLVGEKGMESAAVLEDAKRWFNNIDELLIQPSMDAPDASRVHGTGTHWAPGDLGNYIQSEYPEYKWIIVPARKTTKLPVRENITYLNNPNVGEGESNFPAGGTTAYYVDMAANPAKEIQYWAQHMNLPDGSSKMTKFDYDWLGWYTIEKRGENDSEEWVVCDDGKEFDLKEIQKYGFIDPGGFAETKVVTSGSQNAILIAGQPPTSVRKFVFVADADRMKEPRKFLDKLFAFHAKWKCRMWRVETIGAQKYIYNDIIQDRKRRGVNLPLMEMEPDVGADAKHNRIIALLDPCERREYYFHKSMKNLIDEYKHYTGDKGQLKDLIDMLGCYGKYYGKRGEQEKRVDPPPKMALKEEGTYSDGASEVTGY